MAQVAHTEREGNAGEHRLRMQAHARRAQVHAAGAYKRGPGAPLAPQVQRTNLFQQLLLSPIEEPDIFAFARAGATVGGQRAEGAVDGL